MIERFTGSRHGAEISAQERMNRRELQCDVDPATGFEEVPVGLFPDAVEGLHRGHTIQEENERRFTLTALPKREPDNVLIIHQGYVLLKGLSALPPFTAWTGKREAAEEKVHSFTHDIVRMRVRMEQGIQDQCHIIRHKERLDQNDRTTSIEYGGPVDSDQFEDMWPHAKKLTKVRFVYKYEKFTEHLDVFLNPELRGFVVAELEFKEPRSAEFFDPFLYSFLGLGQDVTQDNRISNSHLVSHGVPVEYRATKNRNSAITTPRSVADELLRRGDTAHKSYWDLYPYRDGTIIQRPTFEN